MPTGTASTTFFADLRAREFARLDATRTAYLDYTGAALYAESQLRAHLDILQRELFGNPHSAHGASRHSTETLDAARHRILRWLDAGDDYVVCFTSNATAAIKLVAEAYPFRPETVYTLAADNHNSVNGVREFAARAGAPIAVLPLDSWLELDRAAERLADSARPGGGLFAYPAQSNFTGVQHPLGLVREAQALGYHVLLDAAAFVPSHRLSLREVPADFVAISFYKMFGYPTGLGALVARKEAMAVLRRPWFAGGTVEYVSVALQKHRLRPAPDGFEDGTPDFLAIAALASGFDLLESAFDAGLEPHVRRHAIALRRGLAALTHSGGAPLVRVYGPRTDDAAGSAVTFNVLDPGGLPLPFNAVEERAVADLVMMRGGCFCNPGATEAAFAFDPRALEQCYGALEGRFTLDALRACLGPSTAVGAIRASVGIATNEEDVQRAIALVASFAQ